MRPNMVKTNFRGRKHLCKTNSNGINQFFVGKEQAVELLAKNGANIDSADEKGRTALYFAVIKCNFEW